MKLNNDKDMKLLKMKFIANGSHAGALALALMALMMFTSCHTTEENYRASYELAANKTKEGVGADTYAKIVAEQRRNTDVVNGDSVRIVAHFVGLIDVEKAQTKRYNVVLRGFKQVVNARSMRDRLIKEGHNAYVLYYEKEKLYYVIIEAFDTREGAADFLHNAKSRVKMNVPLDNLWILEKIN